VTAVLGPAKASPHDRSGNGLHGCEDVDALRLLFHRLNNQLGIVLAHAELLEARTLDAPARARAQQVVASVVDALGTAREIREKTTS
jgi:hypothetical protein